MEVKINNIVSCDFTVRVGCTECTILCGESSIFDNPTEKIYFELIPHNKFKSDRNGIFSAVRNAAANLVLTVSSAYEICSDENITINIDADVYEHSKLKGDLPFAYLYSFIDVRENKNIKCIACNAVDEKDVMKLYKALALTAQAGNSFSLGAIGYIFQIKEIKKLCESHVIFETLKDKLIKNNM